MNIMYWFLVGVLLGFGCTSVGILVGYYLGYFKKSRELSLTNKEFELLLRQYEGYPAEDFGPYSFRDFEEHSN